METLKGKAGRPTLLTPENHRKIVGLVRAGNFPETAAAAAGVSRPTLRAWMKDAGDLRRVSRKLSKKEANLLRFLTDLEEALGEAEARDVLLIGKHAEKDWKAAAWRLERRNRQRWGNTAPQTPEGQAPASVVFSVMQQPEVARLTVGVVDGQSIEQDE